MCKVFVLTNTSKIKKFDKILPVIHKHVTERDNDGFGYSVLGKEGIFGERALGSAFSSRFGIDEVDLPIIERSQNKFGTKSKAVGPAIFHGRTSTNDRTLINTHPLNRDGMSLVHNGVVTDHGPKYKKQTTNDSEDVLHRFQSGGLKALEKHLTGYYAFAAIDAEGKLHVVRDNIATLHVGYIAELESYIFATTPKLIESVCSDLKWKVSAIDPMASSTYAVFQNGALVSHDTFTPRGYSDTESKYASKSLGREIRNSRWEEMSWRDDMPSGETYSYNSRELFLDEVSRADASYGFWNSRDEELTLQEFRKLSDEEKTHCLVMRQDGTVVCPVDYDFQRIA